MDRFYSADSIGKSFGRRQILKNASVWASRGSITAVFGRNGAGKSTLMKSGVGLLAPDYGVVRFAGEAFRRPKLTRLARMGLFYLPERQLLSGRFTLQQHLHAIEWAFPDSRDSGVREAVEHLDLAPFLQSRPGELSGGEIRRAEVAVAFARRPACLIADEPFAGISPLDADRIAAALKSMRRDGCALVLTGHEVPQLMALADEVVWMVAGTTHGVGSPAQAARHDQFRRDYLEPAGGPRLILKN